MLELALVLLFGLALLPIFVTARGRPHTTVFYWGVAAVILWATGLALAFGEGSRPFLILGHAAGPVSATLIFLGARRFARKLAPRWAPYLGAVGALSTGLLLLLVGRQVAVAVQTAISFPLLLASAWVVLQNARHTRAPLPEHALGATLALLALLMPTDIVTRLYVDADAILTPAWATLAFGIAFLTLASLEQRAARRSRRLMEELRERSSALEVERRTLLALLESAPLGIALVGPEGRIRYLNEHGARLLDIGAREQWHRRPASGIVDAIEHRLTPAVRDRVMDNVTGDFSNGKTPPRIEFELDGGARVFSLVSHPVQADDGRAFGRVWIWQDVTEEQKLSERLGQAERMETVGTLAGGIAHDFNNQLTAILGSIGLLLPDFPEDGDHGRAIRNVEHAALHCAELTQGLLAFAKRRPAAARAVLVESVVRDVVGLLRPGLAPGVELSADVAEGTGCILARDDDLRRVVMNLAVNARDAVGSKGAIHIRTRRLDGPEGEQVELSVSDDGPGMDETTRRRIFDPFFSTKGPTQGTGLGLSVVYGIVETHGASIEVESSPGHGATFRLLWPAAPSASEPAERTPPAPAAATPGATVLLAEDDPTVRESTRWMLERAGYRVIEATDGPSVVARFRERAADVDLVLLDLAMPGFSGLEALERIHELEPAQPAILISANLDPFTEALPDDPAVLRKPFRSPDLVARIEEQLAARTSAS